MKDMRGAGVRIGAVEFPEFPLHLVFLAAKIDEQTYIEPNGGQVID